ncbi:MAG: TrkH family potassium uptake protein [Pseudomonadales bacterium]|nr:TrkH family potassium uptake protein [Pseudomonadales bacterium]
MHFRSVLRIIGILLMLFTAILLLPILIAWLYNDSTISTFLYSALITFVVGGAFFLGGDISGELRTRDGFMITVMFYFGIGIFGALPFYLSSQLDVSFTQATFESFSGLTTTGATVLTSLDSLPYALLFYRHLLQWLGGMGIIVLAVAVLPMLGIGGMQLYRAESPGPVKDSKLKPRITETAKALWYIYLNLTIACALAYWVAGMSVFDAICHSFSTVAIGGFSTHDASMAFFDSAWIETVAIVFMVLSGINFGLHFVVWNKRSLMPYFADVEVRVYLFALLSLCILICMVLMNNGDSVIDSPIRKGIFQVVSIATTTGYTTTNFSLWPSLVPIVLLLAAFTGGCAGSTAGGIKIVRVLLLYLQGIRELRRLIHPNGIFPLKLGKNVVPNRVIESVWSFFSVYVILFLLLICLVMGISEMDFITAFSAIGACLNNLGPGLGEVALHYASLTAPTQWILMLAMVLGRLEIFTLLVVLTPTFWRH